MNKKDYTNKKIGRLTAIKFVETDKYQNAKWLFQCDCGNKIVRAAYSVFSGNIHSCGCLKRELLSKFRTTHGMSGKNRFYRIWSGVLDRCKHKRRWYGQVEVCERWKKFENFRDDLLFDYNKHVDKYGIDDTTIDRINTFGDYVPENVRWATRRNRRIIARQYRPKHKVKCFMKGERLMGETRKRT